MALQQELTDAVDKIFQDQWRSRNGVVVPEAESVALGNVAVKLEDAVVLYADIDKSTKLVDSHTWEFAAEIYKAFLYCCARIIRAEGGVITAYDGDRIMAVFIGDSKCTSAARTALKINYCREKIINPLLDKRYPTVGYRLRYTVGIDRSEIHAARTGARGANDLVWVGRAANYAAKLCDLSGELSSWITGSVYDQLHTSLKTTDTRSMWKPRIWPQMNNLQIYGSSWWWQV